MAGLSVKCVIKKLGEVLVHTDNYNFANLNLIQMKNKKFLFNDTFNGWSIC